jgi:hypothetical protein
MSSFLSAWPLVVWQFVFGPFSNVLTVGSLTRRRINASQPFGPFFSDLLATHHADLFGLVLDYLKSQEEWGLTK